MCIIFPPPVRFMVMHVHCWTKRGARIRHPGPLNQKAVNAGTASELSTSIASLLFNIYVNPTMYNSVFRH